MGLPASASASDTNLFHVTASASAKRIGYRTTTRNSHLSANTKYRFSLDWENVSNAPFGSTLFSIYSYTTNGFKNIWNDSTYVSEWNVSSYALEHGNHYDIDFTMKSTGDRELIFYFGDIGKSISSYEFKTANWVLYTRDSNDQLTDTVITTDFSTVEYRQASSGAMDGFPTTTNYNSDSNNSKFWTDYLGSSFSCALEAIPSGYFDVAPISDYTDVTAKVAYFTKGNTGTLRYYNTERTLAAGDYQLGFDWKVLSGDGSYLKLIVGGNTIIESNLGTATGSNSNNTYSATDSYDATNFTRKVTFTLASDATGIEIIIGNSNKSTSAVVSGGYLKAWDGSAVTGGNKIHNIGDANFSSYLNTEVANKWQPWAASTKYVTLRSTVSGLFTAAGATPQRINFKSGQDWCVVQYEDYSPTITAGTYKLVFDCRQFTAALLNVAVFKDTVAVSGTREYDNINRKMYYTFTLDSAPTDSFFIRIGNYGNDGTTASVGHVYLYATVGGVITGDSLIADTNTFTLDWTANTSTNYSQIWNTRGYNNNLIYYGAIPENYFEANNTAAQMVHFPAGSDGYQVLAYKDADIYLAAGTYRLTVDINNLGTGTPTVQLRSGEDISSTYSGTLISTDGFTRTYEFTVGTAARGVGVFIGNYGNGTDLDFYFKNPALYQYANSATVGYNFFEPLTTRTYDRHNWTGKRDNALNARWTPINCNNDVFEISNISDGAFPGAVVTTGTPKMANFYYGASWNVFIYNDEAVSLQKDQTYVFTANVKSTGGTAPTIILYDSYAGGNNPLSGNAYTSAYSDVTSGNTRTITFTMAKTVSVLRIRIGNYSDETDVIASIANVKLVKQGTDANLIADLTDDTIQTTAGNRKWQINGASSGYQNAKEAVNIPAGYFAGTAQANMYYISKVTTAYSGLEKKAKVKADTTYTLEFDWKSYGGAYPKISVTTYNGSAWSGATQTALANNTADGTAIGLSTDPYRPAVLGTYGHYAVSFTTPSDLYASGWSNLNILFANYIQDDDYTHYGRGSMYLGNFVLKESGSSVNIILNGDLAIAKTGNVSSFDSSSLFGGFEISINKNNGTRDLYDELRVLPQPANFFTADGPSTPSKFISFNGGSYDYVRQELVLKSNTTYRLSYNYQFLNAAGNQYIQDIQQLYTGAERAEKGDNFQTIDPTSTQIDDVNSIKYVVFTTHDNLRSDYSNTYLNFYIGPNGDDIIFNFGNVKLYEWNGSANVGPNLIENGGLWFGDEAKDGTAITGLSSAERESRSTGTVQLTGWRIFGYFEHNNKIEVKAHTSGSFPAYQPLNLRLPQFPKKLVGLMALENNVYEDINNDSSFDVKDYVHTKLLAIESSTGLASEAAAEARKSVIYRNNNTTDLDDMADKGLFGQNKNTKPSGTTYYADSNYDESNGSPNGTYSRPWKTLAQINGASIAPNSVVLLKCGSVFRPATNSSGAILSCKNGVTYGSYGSGSKPAILGSYYNYASKSWTNNGGNVYYTSVDFGSTPTAKEVGIVVYGYGALIGDKQLSLGNLAKEGDWYYDSSNRRVYIYCSNTPTNKWNSIEIGQNRAIVDSANGVTINNLCIKYGGKHGIETTNNNICISNCEIGYIGGCAGDGGARLGNGVQFGRHGYNDRVKNCYVYECYDAGLTFQDWETNDTTGFYNINFSGNLIENCNYSIEFFLGEGTGANASLYGITISNNVMRGAGYGWSYNERIGYGEGLGCHQTSHIRVSQGEYYPNLGKNSSGVNQEPFRIYDNIFDSSKGSLIYWQWNADGHEDEQTYAADRLQIYDNTFYQSYNGDDLDGNPYRVITFINEKGSVYGISTNGVRLALKQFEGTVNPTYLTDSRYINKDERVIVN